MYTYNDGEYGVEEMRVTHLPSGAYWDFNLNSAIAQSFNTKNLDKPMTFTAIAEGIWEFHRKLERA
jgi:hypothetical protein